MNCTEATSLMSDLLDEELAEDARRAIESHIASCDACARELRALRRTVRFVRGNAGTTLVPGTPGGVYNDFTQAIADPSYDRTPLEVIVQFLAPDAPEERTAS